MSEADALEVVRHTIWTVIVASGPAVAAAMLVGLVISFLQALTQIQEVTLTFVPKIVVVFFVLLVSASFMGAIIGAFAMETYSRIELSF